ncbi:glycosyltransferase family 2 protein [Pedobacter nyackensis]|uniref:Glycosyltransferase, catalytic subunit of cellulose synthase and poly-beta-1,6-N-acetylglucosamine synthase n=1 Tax=Pedobacter nyackensis TaxID=475255 RepID=A0A1W2DFG7_9SPHI|nr:glycosyltransferase family 2 protein [Pedobacter nyackensis]SMC95726.1 Glycosyltransferase, catalytic subunit of cellulose synthase and poly-beta-1,6-N-acetylglucosamine synthase [Pedobacter nyackensis]
MIVAFWISLFLIIYTFVGYGFLLYFLVKIKRFLVKPFIFTGDVVLPSVSLLIAAYNEEDIIVEKITNTLNLDYPKDKIQIIIITDGSTDRTAELVRGFPEVVLLHEDIRSGKMAAIKRAIPFITGEVTVFTDANTFLNSRAILELVKHYQNTKVGAVAGEKRILVEEKADASSAGEGFYWKYESKLKKWDYDLYSNVGAAGELFSIRTALYQPVEADTIIDDHMIAMRIAEKGFVIAYEPDAYAMETASANSKEELKRKVRIAAGGMQSILRLKVAANPFYYPILTFQYISHRVLRWTITPFLLILVFVLNGLIVLKGGAEIYWVLFVGQVLFYLLSLTGLFFESRNIRIKAFFIPYYFCVMNYAVIAGIVRYFRKNQSAAWEKSKRK